MTLYLTMFMNAAEGANVIEDTRYVHTVYSSSSHINDPVNLLQATYHGGELLQRDGSNFLRLYGVNTSLVSDNQGNAMPVGTDFLASQSIAAYPKFAILVTGYDRNRSALASEIDVCALHILGVVNDASDQQEYATSEPDNVIEYEVEISDLTVNVHEGVLSKSHDTTNFTFEEGTLIVDLAQMFNPITNENGHAKAHSTQHEVESSADHVKYIGHADRQQKHSLQHMATTDILMDRLDKWVKREVNMTQSMNQQSQNVGAQGLSDFFLWGPVGPLIGTAELLFCCPAVVPWGWIPPMIGFIAACCF